MGFISRTTLPVYRTAGIREVEARAVIAAHAPSLMERAGLAAAQIARDMIADGARGVLVLAGPGNNGGDAFVVARHLKEWLFSVDVVFAGDEAKLSGDSRAALAAWRKCGGSMPSEIPANKRWDLVIDGLFGIGLTRDLTGRYAELIAIINSAGTRILALDIASGLDADTGRVLGCAVRADRTATFIALKPGLLTLDGPDYSGEVNLCPLDVDALNLSSSSGWLIGSDIMRTVLPPRGLNTHKGTYGSAAIIGGAPGMVGAALLAGRAAINLGAGRVYVGLLADDAPGYDPVQPELMLRPAHEIPVLDRLDCIAVGPGLGQSPDAWQVLHSTLQSAVPLVVDADALNMIATDANLRALVAQRTAATILTPHPAEGARILECTIAAVQHDRVSAACQIATRLRSSVVLKGAGSICAFADGTWFVNTSGNPGMASAGMGDALTGMVAALLAQGADAHSALLVGVHMHGAAADIIAAESGGQLGITASRVIESARNVLNRARNAASTSH